MVHVAAGGNLTKNSNFNFIPCCCSNNKAVFAKIFVAVDLKRPYVH